MLYDWRNNKIELSSAGDNKSDCFCIDYCGLFKSRFICILDQSGNKPVKVHQAMMYLSPESSWGTNYSLNDPTGNHITVFKNFVDDDGTFHSLFFEYDK